jgi:EAL domain-containing protein (putative c-di-GMP-specific phosphodiesterase class I)
MQKRSTCAACRAGSDLPFDFVMGFQPIIDAAAGGVWGYEALVRGLNGEPAGAVLAQVDDENRYRFDQACCVKAIETAGSLFREPQLRLSINFMPNAVYEPAACIRASLAAAQRVGFSRERIMFEFTENERMPDIAHVKGIVEAYRKFGFITALDDFGSGYAGLGLLAEFRPDLIKIDMNLLRGIHRDPARQTIVSAIVGMARQLDVVVLAEGVEETEEYVVLRAAGINLFQGYLFGKPEIGRLPPVRLPGREGGTVSSPAALGIAR